MNLLLMTGLEALEQRLIQLTEQELGEVHGFSLESIGDFEDYDPNAYQVMIINRYMDQSEEGSDLVRFIKKVRNNSKDIQVIVLLSESEREVIQQLVNVGVFDLIISSSGESLESLARKILRCVQTPATQFELIKAVEIGSQEAISKLETDPEKIGFSLKLSRRVVIESVFKQVIALYSPTGSGASITALNLGIALTETSKCKVLLMGLDLMNPSLANHLEKSPPMTLYQLLSAHEKRMPLNELIEDSTVKVGSLDVIPGSFDFNEYYYLNEQNLKQLIMNLQKYYDYVILDLNGYISDKTTVMALSEAHRIYLVGAPFAKPLQTLMDYQNVIKEKIPECKISGIVMNAFGGMCLTSIEIETLLGTAPVAYIKQNKQLSHIGPKNLFYRKKVKKLYKTLVKEVQR